MSVSQLTISDLRVWVHLGCSEQEKYHPQAVSIDVQVNFLETPKAVASDNLSQTFCYLKASELIQTSLKNKPFNLIEYLAAYVYDLLAQHMLKESGLKATLVVVVKKLAPPVPGVYGGVTFTYAGE